MSSATFPLALAAGELKTDRVLLGLALSLLAIGFVAISSASVEYAEAQYGNAFHLSTRHLVYLVLALAGGAVVSMLPVSFWFNTGWVWLFLGLAMLVLVLIPGLGREVNGSRRWLSVAGFTLQASEFAKLFLIVYLAGYLQRRELQVRSEWQGFIKPMAVVFAITLLLLVEPDFGATVVTVGTAFGMMFLAGVRIGQFMLVVLAAVAALAVLLVAEPYRLERLIAYTDPWADPYASGYQLTQSLIAYGRGEWFGVGLGNSVQKLSYLPEAHTDFVLAIWAEEMGLMGSVLVIGLYLGLVYRILWQARESGRAGDLFGAHICNGIALVFAAQAFINIGVSTGLLPTKGLTLPLISYGGSSLIVCCAMLALVLRIDFERGRDKKQARRGKKRGR
jgi:cell division protein FtsW